MNEDTIPTIYRSMLIERATDFARSGAYAEAEQVLAEAKAEDEEDPIVFDLLARIRAQQRRYSEAEVFWKEAARLDPGNAEYRAGLARVRAIEKHPYLAIPWTLILMGGLTVTALILAGVSLWSTTTGELESQAVVTTAQPLPPMAPVQVVPERSAPKPPTLALNVPGVLLSSEGDNIVVKFENGLFDSGIHLRPEARKMLTLVAKQLKAYGEKFQIEIVGHTNDLAVPPGSLFADNIDLGLRRAVVVTNLLRKSADSQPFTVLISSRGEADPPFRPDSSNSRTGNRTVTFRISRLSIS